MVNATHAKDFLASLFSVAVILFAAYLYFTNFHVLPEQRFSYYSGTATIYSNGSVKASATPAFHFPRKPVIILRLDDVQGAVSSKGSINLTETMLSRNLSVVLGIIPINVLGDPVRDYLKKNRDNPRLEYALHGTYHNEQEYANLTAAEALERMTLGKKMFVESTGKIPVTFIPPYNAYSPGTVIAAEKLGFKVFSAGFGEYRFSPNGKVFQVGFSARTKEYGDNEEGEGIFDAVGLNAPNKVADQCLHYVRTQNVCVIMIHPQEYVFHDGSIDPDKFASFIDLLDAIHEINATSVTFKDMVS